MMNKEAKEQVEKLLNRIIEGDRLNEDEVAGLFARRSYLSAEQLKLVREHAKLIGAPDPSEGEPAKGAAAPSAELALEKMTKAELIEKGKTLGLSLSDDMKKDEMIEAINTAK